MLSYDHIYELFDKDNVTEFEKVLDKFNINYFIRKDSFYFIKNGAWLSILMLAVDLDSMKILEMLIKKGIDLDVFFADTPFGTISILEFYLITTRDAFDTGCGRQPSKKILDLFRKANIELDFESLKQYGLPDTKMLEVLVECGANINQAYKNGYTALDTAVKLRHWSGILYLLSKGAKHSKNFFRDNFLIKDDFLSMDKLYKTDPYIQHLKSLKEEDCIETKEPKIFHYELERIKIRNDRTNIPYNIGFLNWIDIEENNINEEDETGKTPLDLAVKLKNEEAIEYLKNHGAKTAKELEAGSKD